MILSNQRPLRNSLKEFDTEEYILLITKSMDEDNSNKFKLVIKDLIDNYHQYFNDEFFTKEVTYGSKNVFYIKDNILSLVIPFIRKVYSKFFINIPSLFSDGRLKIFQYKFNLNEIVPFFKDKISKNLHILDDFENIDRYSNILSIICEDFVAMKISEVQEISDIKSTLRDLKIEEINE
jgi:hypothetical protein